MTAAERDDELESWQRREGFAYRVLPPLLLAISVVVTLLQAMPGGSLPIVLGLAVLAAGWTGWVALVLPAYADRPAPMTVFFTGLTILSALLVIRAPWFGIFAWSGYLYAVRLPGRAKIAGVAATAAVMGTSQLGGLPDLTLPAIATWAVIVVINMLLAGALTYFAWAGDQQAQRRRRTIDALAEANARLETMMAENTALHARLVTQARAAGVAEERERMAREIHDTLAQGLAGVITQVQAAKQARDRPADQERHLDTAAQLARDSLSEARRSVRALAPEPLENSRLPDALADVAAGWSATSGIVAEITTTGNARPLHPEVEVTLLRAAQEALANVAKHAGATRVGLTLSYMEDVVTLDVRDDGGGFAPALARTGDGDGGYGLTAMRQRVRRLAGTLEIESEPGGGTAVCASVPAIPRQPRR
ncbi:sensor histidine kinase [Actinomadura scrupuli]|uniref:sensor histidine kinase n=1 Tax=Actinomadura scrupuli TaxID=559629 RepID=UPI003D960D48